MKKLLFLIPFMFFTACAPDRNTEDYNREKLDTEISKYKAVEGTYSGETFSKADNQLLGAIKVTLKSQTKTVPGAQKSEQVATLVAQLDFVNDKVVSAACSDSGFDIVSKRFTCNIPMTRSDGKPFAVSVTGSIDGSDFAGGIEVLGYSSTGGNFKLTKDAEFPPKSWNGQFPGKSAGTKELGTFEGNLVFNKGENVKGSLVLLKPLMTTELEFLDLFMPSHFLTVNFSFNSTFGFVFENSYWDQANGKLTGTTVYQKVPMSSEKFTLKLECDGLDANVGSKPLACQFTTGIIGKVATANFNFVQGGKVTDPTDPPGPSRPTERRSFSGLAVYSPTRSDAVTASVTRPEKSYTEMLLDLLFPREFEIVQATIQLPGEVIITFSAANYNLAKKSLEGKFTMNAVDGPFDLNLSCQSFDFESKTGEFSCDYVTGRMINPIKLKMKY